MRVVDDDGNIIKTGDPETDAVSDSFDTVQWKNSFLKYYFNIILVIIRDGSRA